MEVKYKPGKENKLADLLSRKVVGECLEKCNRQMVLEVQRQMSLEKRTPGKEWKDDGSLEESAKELKLVRQRIEELEEEIGDTPQGVMRRLIATEIAKDKTWRKLLLFKEGKLEKPSKRLHQKAERYLVRDGMLFVKPR